MPLTRLCLNETSEYTVPILNTWNAMMLSPMKSAFYDHGTVKVS